MYWSLKTCVSIFLFSIIIIGNAQKKEQAAENAIAEQYKAYFAIPRKSIHLHLNKSTFVSGEQIWFSTYIYNKKDNAISLEEEYININLINSLGQVLSSKTVLHSQNNGYSDILLESNLPSGEYFLQAYTTAMQSFVEDDSAVYKIKVLNYEDVISTTNEDSKSLEQIQIEIQPESGQLLEGILGSCAIRITDGNNNPVIPDKVLLTSPISSKSSNVRINVIGIGRFSLIPSANSRYQIEVYIGEKVFTQKVPLPRTWGYTISADYNYGKDLLLVSINKKGKVLEQNLSLLVHKDGNLLTVPIYFDRKKTSAEIILPFSSLFTGVNTLSLVMNNKVLAERLVFAHTDNSTLSAQLLSIERQNDSMIVFIKNNSKKLPSATNRLSISVLPHKSLSDIEYQSIPSSFFLSGNIPNETISQLQKVPFIEEDSAKYLLDNALMLEGWGRYKWKNISNPNLIPVKQITGLNEIDGYVNLFDAKNDSLLVVLYSKDNGLFETTLLNDEKKFRFSDLTLAEESKFTLTLLDKNGKPVYTNFFFTTIPKKEKYRHPYIPKIKNSPPIKPDTSNSTDLFFKKVEKLEGVTISANKLKRERFFGNYDGRKIDSFLISKGTLENYIRSYGFNVHYISPRNPDPRIAGTRQFMKQCKGEPILSPMIVFDGIFDKYAINYAHIGLEYIDEIYYKSNYCGPALFVVFTNEKYKNRPISESQKVAKQFTVKNGYNPSSSFVRPEYHSKTNSSFERYGIISWIPKLISNNQGVVSFKIPDDGQKKLRLQLQGFSENGDLISDELLIELPNGK